MPTKVGLIPLVLGIVFTIGCILAFIVVTISPPLGWDFLDFIILSIMLIFGIFLVIVGIIILIKDPNWYTDFRF